VFFLAQMANIPGEVAILVIFLKSHLKLQSAGQTLKTENM